MGSVRVVSPGIRGIRWTKELWRSEWRDQRIGDGLSRCLRYDSHARFLFCFIFIQVDFLKILYIYIWLLFSFWIIHYYLVLLDWYLMLYFYSYFCFFYYSILFIWLSVWFVESSLYWTIVGSQVSFWTCQHCGVIYIIVRNITTFPHDFLYLYMQCCYYEETIVFLCTVFYYYCNISS